jgi:hypothetical protein
MTLLTTIVTAGNKSPSTCGDTEHCEPRKTRQLMTGTDGYFHAGRTVASGELLMTLLTTIVTVGSAPASTCGDTRASAL